jgi:hypothetical protein
MTALLAFEAANIVMSQALGNDPDTTGQTDAVLV